MLAKNQSTKSKVANYILSYVPFSLLKGMFKVNPLIGYFHIVSDEDVPHIKHLYAYKNVKQFKEDLDFILRNFNPLSLSDFLGHLKTGQMLPDNSFFLTFDDGLREVNEIIAPILLSKGVPGTFFISSAFIDNLKLAHDHKASLIIERLKTSKSSILLKKTKDILQAHGYQITNYENCILKIEYQHRMVLNEIADTMSIDFKDYLTKSKPYLTFEQLKDMIKKGFSIGAHSIDHPWYSSLSLEEQLYQTIESVKFIKERFQLDYGVFAFPHNDHGVSKKLFTELYNSGLVDATFGTEGIINDIIPNNFQRFSLEKPLMPAKELVAYQFAKKIYRMVKGSAKIPRT